MREVLGRVYIEIATGERNKRYRDCGLLEQRARPFVACERLKRAEESAGKDCGDAVHTRVGGCGDSLPRLCGERGEQRAQMRGVEAWLIAVHKKYSVNWRRQRFGGVHTCT